MLYEFKMKIMQRMYKSNATQITTCKTMSDMHSYKNKLTFSIQSSKVSEMNNEVTNSYEIQFNI